MQKILMVVGFVITVVGLLRFRLAKLPLGGFREAS